MISKTSGFRGLAYFQTHPYIYTYRTMDKPKGIHCFFRRISLFFVRTSAQEMLWDTYHIFDPYDDGLAPNGSSAGWVTLW